MQVEVRILKRVVFFLCPRISCFRMAIELRGWLNFYFF